MRDKPKVWKQSEIEYLKANCGKIPRRVMAEELGIKPRQISKKLYLLNLEKPERADTYYGYKNCKYGSNDKFSEEVRSGKVWSVQEQKDILWRYHATWERRKFMEIFKISSERLDELYDEVLAEHDMCVGIYAGNDDYDDEYDEDEEYEM